MKLTLLILLTYWVTGHAATDWEMVKDKEAISIYSIQHPNHKLKHFKAETEINKDTDTILSALQDTEACSEWVYKCISSDVVGMSDVRKRIYHTVINSPLWFKDRDFYLQSQVIYDPKDQSFTIDFESKPGYAEESKVQVRVKDIEMQWRLQYLAEDKTAVTYQVYIDPKLPIKAINHKMIEKSIFQTMLGLTKLVENPEYAITKYSESELEMLIEDD